MQKLWVGILLLFATGMYAQGAPQASTDPWKPLRFLIGNWEAKTAGKTEAAGSYSFATDLKDHVLVRTSKTASCATAAGIDCEHGDVLYVYPEGSANALKAIYFDNEGHVLHYDVTTPGADSVVFLTDPSQPGPQFRLGYQLKDGVISGKFQVKPPGAPAFVSYLEWSGRRK